jgi:2-keto-4-pentenoate hydratase
MSGSFTRQYALTRGDRVESRFDPVGPVTAEFP